MDLALGLIAGHPRRFILPAARRSAGITFNTAIRTTSIYL